MRMVPIGMSNYFKNTMFENTTSLSTTTSNFQQHPELSVFAVMRVVGFLGWLTATIGAVVVVAAAAVVSPILPLLIVMMIGGVGIIGGLSVAAISPFLYQGAVHPPINDFQSPEQLEEEMPKGGRYQTMHDPIQTIVDANQINTTTMYNYKPIVATVKHDALEVIRIFLGKLEQLVQSLLLKEQPPQERGSLFTTGQTFFCTRSNINKPSNTPTTESIPLLQQYKQ